MHRDTWLSACAGLALVLLATGSVAHAQGRGQAQDANNQGRPDNGDQEKGSNQGGNDRNGEKPKPATTPELDAGVLYAIGIAGAAGTLLYMRQRRRGAARAD